MPRTRKTCPVTTNNKNQRRTCSGAKRLLLGRAEVGSTTTSRKVLTMINPTCEARGKINLKIQGCLYEVGHDAHEY